jgi:hypothetical protein
MTAAQKVMKKQRAAFIWMLLSLPLLMKRSWIPDSDLPQVSYLKVISRLGLRRTAGAYRRPNEPGI